MCGRYVSPDDAEIERWGQLTNRNWKTPFTGAHAARYNVAPQQGNPANYVPVIRDGGNSLLEVTDMQWWLLPWWAKAAKSRYTTFNARVETVMTSPTFKEPYRRRRCLIPARGWFEWQTTPDGKQPWFFHARDGGLLTFAGLWDRWHQGDQVIESCTIVVGEPPSAVADLHDRAPFIIPREHADAWLNPDFDDPDEVRCLLEPWSEMDLAWHPVSRDVGNVRNGGAELIDPIDISAPR